MQHMTTNHHSLLLTKTANDVLREAAQMPVPKMLFGEFWHEGELSILFADTNVGKSILAVQIADSISKGEAIPGFELQSKKQQVLYLDFELSAKQFEKRYSNNYEDHYQFDNQLYRIEFNPDCLLDGNLEDVLFTEVEANILTFGAKVIIVDNLTYLKTQATDTAKEALPLMRKLKELKMKYDLSMLVLAHTPKRNPANPINKNDLAGSKHLANFADSIFAIGESQSDHMLRYLKQIKARATEIVFHEGNVALCTISKPASFLKFDFLQFDNERSHLYQSQPNDSENLDSVIVELKSNNPGISNAEIARRAQTYEMKVLRTLNKYTKSKIPNI